jgi:EAL domain-containing protein (putative c-di-GMP-specific phosphodiesterase class I)
LSIDARRLLGFAFAAADLLLEIAPGTHRITCALGASQAVLGPEPADPVGCDWRDLVHADDRPLVEAMFVAVEDGVRRAFAPVRLARGRAVGLNARMLPETGGGISCALTHCPPPRVAATADGLHTRTGFESIVRELAEAARLTGAELEVALIEMAGLGAAGEAASLRAAGALRLEAEGGVAAARLSPERFALLRRRGDDSAALARRLARAVTALPGVEVAVEGQAQIVPLEGVSASRLSRALHLALEDFEAEGLAEASPGTLAQAMNRSVRRTLARAGELGAAVSQRRFTLAFQPVVGLADGALHHHEVLVRFENAHSPFALVRMAEEFDLIEELDQAVTEQAVRRMRGPRGADERLAVNVSGRTITSPGYLAAVRGMLKSATELGKRLLFEITESAAIDDLALADRHVQALREMGARVCLEDFGAGAASLAYLQRLSVDIVKIDGRYVRDLVTGGRDAALVSHIVNLCRDLGVQTVAEMVETPEIEAAAIAAGVDYGQGWLYGRPADRPEAPPARPAPSALARPGRRAGAKLEWG